MDVTPGRTRGGVGAIDLLSNSLPSLLLPSIGWAVVRGGGGGDQESGTLCMYVSMCVHERWWTGWEARQRQWNSVCVCVRERERESGETEPLCV